MKNNLKKIGEIKLLKLPEDRYRIIFSLLDNIHISLNVLPIINKTFKGEIWVDNLKHPTIVYVFDTRHAHFLFGDISSNLKILSEFVEIKIIPLISSSKIPYSFLYSNSWKYLSETKNFAFITESKIIKRLLFKFKEFRYPSWKSKIPDGIDIVRVTKSFLKMNLKNIEGLKNELNHMWGDVDKFFEFGFGVCALFNDSLAGWCLGEYFSSYKNIKHFGIGIETYSEFQRKGIAFAMA
ncbi:MAG: GNAT family N-acetyltransferase, partial [Candidatus Kariarchaeaceae archaeon]